MQAPLLAHRSCVACLTLLPAASEHDPQEAPQTNRTIGIVELSDGKALCPACCSKLFFELKPFCCYLLSIVCDESTVRLFSVDARNGAVERRVLANALERIGCPSSSFLLDPSPSRSIERKWRSTQQGGGQRERELDNLLREPTNPMKTVRLRVGGMTCASCVGTVESFVSSSPGVEKIVVSLLLKTAQVEYDSSQISPLEIKEAIETVGFEADFLTEEKPGRVILNVNGSPGVKELLSSQRGINSISFLPLHNKKKKKRNNKKINKNKNKNRKLKEKDGEELLIDEEMGMRENEREREEERERERESEREREGGENECVLVIDYDNNVILARDIIRLLNSSSFGPCTLYKEEKSTAEQLKRTKEIATYRSRLIACLFFAIPIFVTSMILPMTPAAKYTTGTTIVPGLTVGLLINFLLSTPVVFYIGRSFIFSAYSSLSHCATTMDVLVTLGTQTAYWYSFFSTVFAIADYERFYKIQQDYFETSVYLIMFIVMGRWLENVAKGKTSNALSLLLNLQPSTALLVEDLKKNKEVEIETDLIVVGDVVKVYPGSKVPMDGVVVSGRSEIDESMISGESLPKSRTVGDEVIGGSLNQQGMILVRVTKIGEDSTVSKISKLVEQAQNSKAPIQIFANKIASVFVPLVILIALITLFVWLSVCMGSLVPFSWFDGAGSSHGMRAGERGARGEEEHTVSSSSTCSLFSVNFAIAVLVIACPCAMGLATPTAVMVGTGLAAQYGVLLKSGEALEKTNKVNCIVFDKTGTLTYGKPTITDVIPLPPATLSSVLFLSASAETASEHPLAKSIVLYAQSQEISLSTPLDSSVVVGSGVQATVEGKKVKVGTARWIEEERCVIPADVRAIQRSFDSQAKTSVLVAVDGEVVGVIALADTLKEEAPATIRYLRHEMNIDVYMITGDNNSTALAIASQAGIKPSNVFSEVRPEHKAAKVQGLQNDGFTVCMVGDGINDSPALAAADVGLAIGAGTEIAIETAGAVLMKSYLSDVVIALQLCKKTVHRIRMNYVWAFGYNIILIPVAAGVFFPLIHPVVLPPSLAALAMALSSVSVVLSSLALRFYTPPRLRDV